MIRVRLPAPLQDLANLPAEIQIEVEGTVTQNSIIDSLEKKYPALRGALRDPVTRKRRAFVRFFACKEDLSHQSPDVELPSEVLCGQEPFLVVGSISGG